MEESTRAISIIVADDHPIFRHGLRKVLEAKPGFHVMGEAADGERTIKLARELTPDILLLDLRMPHLSGLDVLRELAILSPPMRTIVLTAEITTAEIIEAIQLGIRGVILKESATEVLFECIHTVMAGRYWIGREKVSDLMCTLHSLLPPSTARPARKSFGLTHRELQIVAAVLAGYTNKDMAERFSISEHTVKHHLTNIFDKLGVSNRLELLLFALENQLANARLPWDA